MIKMMIKYKSLELKITKIETLKTLKHFDWLSSWQCQCHYN